LIRDRTPLPNIFSSPQVNDDAASHLSDGTACVTPCAALSAAFSQVSGEERGERERERERRGSVSMKAQPPGHGFFCFPGQEGADARTRRGPGALALPHHPALHVLTWSHHDRGTQRRERLGRGGAQ